MLQELRRVMCDYELFSVMEEGMVHICGGDGDGRSIWVRKGFAEACGRGNVGYREWTMTMMKRTNRMSHLKFQLAMVKRGRH